MVPRSYGAKDDAERLNGMALLAYHATGRDGAGDEDAERRRKADRRGTVQPVKGTISALPPV